MNSGSGLRPTEKHAKIPKSDKGTMDLVAAHADDTATVASGERALDDWLSDVDGDGVEAHGAEHVLGLRVDVKGSALGVEAVEPSCQRLYFD